MPRGFNIKKFYILPTQYASENKQRLFPNTTLTDLFLQPRRSVFTARYDLGFLSVVRLLSDVEGFRKAIVHSSLVTFSGT